MPKRFWLSLLSVLALAAGATCSYPAGAGAAGLRAGNAEFGRGLASVCSDAAVVILGERHREARSHALFASMVDAFVARGERVVVGLEVGSDRQPALDAALRGLGPTDGLAVPPVDSASYRALIRTLGEYVVRPASPVRVVAIDAPPRRRVDRDAEMASRLEEEIRRGPCDRALVLVGNLHALKEIPWAADSGERGPALAGLLAARGLKVVSLVQRFEERCGEASEAELLPAGAETASAAVCGVWSCLPTDPGAERRVAPLAVDGVVAWTCPAAESEGRVIR